MEKSVTESTSVEGVPVEELIEATHKDGEDVHSNYSLFNKREYFSN